MIKYVITLILLINTYTLVLANPNINARTGILIDYDSDEVLYELDPDIQIYPASMTKIMTAIVAFDLIKKKTNKEFEVLSGPYKSINLLKNDYIDLKIFGFEELDVFINE